MPVRSAGVGIPVSAAPVGHGFQAGAALTWQSGRRSSNGSQSERHAAENVSPHGQGGILWPPIKEWLTSVKEEIQCPAPRNPDQQGKRKGDHHAAETRAAAADARRLVARPDRAFRRRTAWALSNPRDRGGGMERLGELSKVKSQPVSSQQHSLEAGMNDLLNQWGSLRPFQTTCNYRTKNQSRKLCWNTRYIERPSEKQYVLFQDLSDNIRHID